MAAWRPESAPIVTVGAYIVYAVDFSGDARDDLIPTWLLN